MRMVKGLGGWKIRFWNVLEREKIRFWNVKKSGYRLCWNVKKYGSGTQKNVKKKYGCNVKNVEEELGTCPHAPHAPVWNDSGLVASWLFMVNINRML